MVKPQMQSLYKHDPETVARLIAGELILVPIRKNVGEMESIYTLNETAARVWELVDGQRTVREIIAEFCDEYDIDPLQAEQDLLEIIDQLSEKGVLVNK